MTPDKALNAYFNTFAKKNGLKAYPSTSVPDDIIFPWMTYEFKEAEFNEDVNITVNLWYHTDSEAQPNATARALKKYVQENSLISCDNGAIWVKIGSPFVQSLTDEVDRSVKRRYINLDLEFQIGE